MFFNAEPPMTAQIYSQSFAGEWLLSEVPA